MHTQMCTYIHWYTKNTDTCLETPRHRQNRETHTCTHSDRYRYTYKHIDKNAQDILIHIQTHGQQCASYGGPEGQITILRENSIKVKLRKLRDNTMRIIENTTTLRENLIPFTENATVTKLEEAGDVTWHCRCGGSQGDQKRGPRRPLGDKHEHNIQNNPRAQNQDNVKTVQLLDYVASSPTNTQA